MRNAPYWRCRKWLFDLTVVLIAASTCNPASSGEVLQSRIVVEPNKVERDVASGIFGSNLEWFRNACGLWQPQAGKTRKDFVQLITAMHPSIIRFPGGTLADYYHWHDGVGPASSRPVRKHIMDDDQSQMNFGTDEFVQFCRQVGAEPMLQINVVSADAHEAARWVSYCNSPDNAERKANGHAKPYGVKYWEIGNEQYLKSDDKRTKQSFCSAAEYGKKLLQCVRAMKAVDPSIKIGAVGGKNFGRYNLVADQEWNAKILPVVGPHIDFLSLHNGYFPLIIEPGFQSFDDAYKALLASPIWMERNIDETEREIVKLCPADAARIKLGITEWAPLFHVLPDNRWVDHPKTLGSALFTASVLETLLRSKTVAIANHMKLVDELFLGVFSHDGVPKPSYFVFQMFREHIGAKIVSTTVTSPTYACPALGLVEKLPAVPYIDAVTSLSSDKRELAIFIVNKHFSQAIPCQMEIKNFPLSKVGRRIVLTGPSMDSNNGNDLVQIPGLRWAKQTAAAQNPLFESGRPGNVTPVASTLSIGESKPGCFDYLVPPRSFCVLVLTRAQ